MRQQTTGIGYTRTEKYIAIEDLQKYSSGPDMNPIHLDYYGGEQCESGHTFGPYVRSSFVLHMIIRGKGCLRKNGASWRMRAGQAFLIRPGEETVYQADEKDPWHYLWIGFHGFRAEQVMWQAGFDRDNPVITLNNVSQVHEIMKELLEARDLTYVNELLRMSALYRLLAFLTQGSESRRDEEIPLENSDREYVQTAVNLLTRTDGVQMKVSEIAKSIGISRNYLTAIFTKEMGVSPQKYQMNFRMEKAGSLLRVTRNPIGTVAAAVGYSDPLAFSKAFRNRYGMSPTEYRETKPRLEEYTVKGEYTSMYPL